MFCCALYARRYMHVPGWNLNCHVHHTACFCFIDCQYPVLGNPFDD